MKMHGYFQLQVPPNAYSLSLALSELVLLNNFGIDAFKVTLPIDTLLSVNQEININFRDPFVLKQLSDKEHKADVAAMKPKSKTTKAHVSLVALDREYRFEFLFYSMSNYCISDNAFVGTKSWPRWPW